MRWYFEDWEVLDAIAECGGYASLTVLAEQHILYTAWQLQSMGYLHLVYRESHGWGFALEDADESR